MNTDELEELCRTELKKIEFLYSPEDDIRASELIKNQLTTINYSSDQWNEEFPEEELEEDPYKGTTQINLALSNTFHNLGYFESVALHHSLRGKRIGKDMMNAVENIFRTIGKTGIYSHEIINPEFLSHMGYSIYKRTNTSGFYSGIKRL